MIKTINYKIIFFAGLIALLALFGTRQSSAQDIEGGIDAVIAAAGAGDLVKLKASLAKGVDVNARDELGVTALIEASFAGHLPVVLYLLKEGADPNLKDDSGASPLDEALGKDHADVALALIKAGSDPNQLSGTKQSVLYRAVELGNLDLLKAAIEKVAKMNTPDPENYYYSPLTLAAENNDLAAAKALVAAGEKPEVSVYRGNLMLGDPIKAGKNRGKMVQLLLSAGASPNKIDLANAAVSDLKLFRKFMKNTALRNAETLHYSLVYAVEKGNLKAVKEVIKYGADPKYKPASIYDQADPLMVTAIKNNDLKMVKLLIKIGADVNDSGSSRALPIALATHAGRTDLVKALAAGGANLADAIINLPNSHPHLLTYEDTKAWIGSDDWADRARLLIKVGASVDGYAIETAMNKQNYAVVREWLPLVREWGKNEGSNIFRVSESYDRLITDAAIAKECALVTEIRQMFRRKTGYKAPEKNVYSMTYCK